MPTNQYPDREGAVLAQIRRSKQLVQSKCDPEGVAENSRGLSEAMPPDSRNRELRP